MASSASMDCDTEQDMINNINSDNSTSSSFHSMNNSNSNSSNLNSNSNPNSMDIDDNNDNSSNKTPKTLFAKLLAKRRQSRNKHNRNKNVLNDASEKLNKAELRVVKDLKEISDSKWCARGTIINIHLFQNLMNFKCTISPKVGYYRNGSFTFNIFINKNYPFIAPIIKSCHPIFHPNINLNTFDIGLSILNIDWKAVLSLNDVLFALQLLFCQPNIEEICKSKSKFKSIDSEYGRGHINHKPQYINNIKPQCNSTGGSGSLIQNMNAALLFRDNRDKYNKISQQIIRGNCNMYGIYWKCIQSKLILSQLNYNNQTKFSYDSNLIHSQSFQIKDTLLIKKTSSLLRKRTRNELNNNYDNYYDSDYDPDCDNNNNNNNNTDSFSMNKMQNVLRCFASTTGSIKDGHYDSSESNNSLINGFDHIDIHPQKKRKICTITENDLKPPNINNINNGNNGNNINNFLTNNNNNNNNNNTNQHCSNINDNGFKQNNNNNYSNGNNNNYINNDNNVNNNNNNSGQVFFDFPWNK